MSYYTTLKTLKQIVYLLQRMHYDLSLGIHPVSYIYEQTARRIAAVPRTSYTAEKRAYYRRSKVKPYSRARKKYCRDYHRRYYAMRREYIKAQRMARIAARKTKNIMAR